MPCTPALSPWPSQQSFYSGARKPANTSFDQITVHRINIVEPDGTTRMVLSNHAEFPGAFYMGKEYPRTDRDATGMLFNNEEGTENGGLIFGGNKDKDGITHSYGHLSFDEYNRDQTLAMESSSDGGARDTYYAVNDDDTPGASLQRSPQNGNKQRRCRRDLNEQQL